MLKHDLLKATALQSKFCNLMPMTMVAGVFGGSYIIPQSIRFNDDDSAYMYRIPSVAGNRKTGTFHTDLKLCNLTLARGLFVAYSDASNYSEIILDAADKLIVTFRVAGTSYTWTSTRVLRDPGAWAGGLTVGWDTTASSGNRLSVEYGGEGVAGSWGTEVPLNTDTQFSNTVLHQIAARNTVGTPVNYGDFYLADVHGVDGAKVAGASFGKFNANGVWAPVEYVPGTVGAATTMAYVGQTVDTSTLTTFTFSSHAIGTASPDRKVIVGISSVGTGRWVTSMTIGGIAAKLVVRSAMSADHVALWQADVPTGTTADIVVTFNTTSSHCAIGVYEATGVGALYSTDLDITNSAAMPTSVTCPENGFIIGVAGCTVGTDTFSWTNLTEDFDQVIAGANHYSGASDTFGSHQSERVVTATPATPGTEQGTVVAAWGPVTNGAYGINGFHIDGSNSAALGEDQSGNGNNFTTSGLTSADQMLDSPTDDIGGTGASDFCTWNPLNKRSTSLLSDGNLKYVGNSGSFYATGGTIAVGSGKWYWEVTCPVVGGADNTDIGIALSSWVTTDHVSPVTPLGCYDSYNGKYYPVSSGTAGTYGATYTSGDVIGIALDLDNGAIWFSKNGTWQNSATIGEVEAGTTTNAAETGLTDKYIPAVANYNANSCLANFGQSTFAYTQPTGFKTLCTANLPAPQRSGHVDSQFVSVYSDGDGVVADLDAAKDEAWLGYINLYKPRNGTGPTIWRFSDDTGNTITSATTAAKVAWSAPSGATTYAGHSFRVGTEYGIYTAELAHTNGVATTHAHGLTSDSGRFMTLLKITNTTGSWWMQHPELTASTYNINFDFYASETATSYVLTDATNVVIQSALPTGTYRVIVFAEMPGWRDFGIFTGNASTDGPVSNTGGSPKWQVRKWRNGGESWHVKDTVRVGCNVDNYEYQIDYTVAEGAAQPFDFLSNGTKERNTVGGINGSGRPIITWTEQTPFGGEGVSQGRAK